MFEVGALITCKKECDLNYGVTNSDGVYAVETIKDGLVYVRVKRHKDKVSLNEVFEFPSAFIESDFEAISQELSDEISDEINVVKKWKDGNTYAISDRDINDVYNIALNSISLISSEQAMDAQLYKDLRTIINLPQKPFVKNYPLKNIVFQSRDMRDAKDEKIVYDRISSDITKNSGYELSEFFAVVSDEILDSVVDKFLTSKFKNIPYRDDLTLKCFKKKHKVYVFKKDNVYVYITNILTDEVLNMTALFMYEQQKISISKETFDAVIASDRKLFIESISPIIIEYKAEETRLIREAMFCDFEKVYRGSQERVSENRYNNSKEEARMAYEEYLSRLKSEKEAEIRLFYFKNGMNVEDEFIEFVKKFNTNIVSIKLSDNNIRMCVKAFLTYFEDRDYVSIRNSGSYGSFNSLNDAYKNLFDDIFMNKTIRLQFEQRFELRISELKPLCRGDNFEQQRGEGKNGFTNPHFQRHDCWGSHKSIISKYLRDGDILSAYNQSYAAISGLTITDSTVFNELIGQIKSEDYKNKPCLFDKDNNVMTIREYVENYKKSGAKWVKDVQKAKETKGE